MMRAEGIANPLRSEYSAIIWIYIALFANMTSDGRPPFFLFRSDLKNYSGIDSIGVSDRTNSTIFQCKSVWSLTTVSD